MSKCVNEIAASVHKMAVSRGIKGFEDPQGLSKQHAVWMLAQVLAGMETERANRYVSWAQCLLTVHGVTDLETERARVRAYVQDAGPFPEPRDTFLLSIDRDHEGYRPDAIYWAVTCDGKFVEDCVEANVRSGYAVQSSAGAGGKVVHNGTIVLFAPGTWESSEDHAA